MICFFRGSVSSLVLAVSVLLAGANVALAGQEQGHPIGTVATRGNLIVLTLDKDVLGKPNLFNLAHRTLRFTPEGSGYRVSNVPWQWDSEFGPKMATHQAELKGWAFPFSGKNWTSMSVGTKGTITFGEPSPTSRRPHHGADAEDGISIDRFAELQEAAGTLVDTIPLISVFYKPRMVGERYAKQMADRAVVTWSLTEPYGGIQDWSWTPTVNRFQAVLRPNGVIELSYDQVAAQDGIVGVYPLRNKGVERTLVSYATGGKTASTSPSDVTGVTLAAVDDLRLKVALQTSGPLPNTTDPMLLKLAYQVCLSRDLPVHACAPETPGDVIWTVRGGHVWNDAGVDPIHFRYRASGAGLSPEVLARGNTLSMSGMLPRGYKSGDTVYVSVSSVGPNGTLATPPHVVKLAGLTSPEVDLSTVTSKDGLFPVVYEAFHYRKPPRDVDLTCTVLGQLGDRFDMLAYYSDFRIDNPEAGTSSNGPLGGGPSGGAVTGIGAEQQGLSDYCTKGRFQWQFIQPVYVGANQMQEYPPAGVVDPSRHDITGYTHQLAERTFNGRIPPYDYAMSQIGHEMGHRWSAFVSAKVGGQTIPLGPTHWDAGLQAQVAFPYQRPVEASLMGGGVWQDNFDGSFTQLDDNYYVPATGWSYLDLYLMGLIGADEVPDFFLLRNMVRSSVDENGRALVKADRTKVTVQNVIDAEGPRLPDVDHSQRLFNTGMVVVVESGKAPSQELLDRTEGIRLRWMDFWETTTGHRSSMTTEPN